MRRHGDCPKEEKKIEEEENGTKRRMTRAQGRCQRTWGRGEMGGTVEHPRRDEGLRPKTK